MKKYSTEFRHSCMYIGKCVVNNEIVGRKEEEKSLKHIVVEEQRNDRDSLQ